MKLLKKFDFLKKGMQHFDRGYANDDIHSFLIRNNLEVLPKQNAKNDKGN